MVVEKNKKDVVKMSFEKIIYKLTDKRIPADTGLGLVGDILETAGYQERFKNVGSENKRSKKHINTGEILITFIALLCKGNPDFDGVVEFQNDAAFYQTALHLQKGFPSSSTLRMRMDSIGKSQREQLLKFNAHLLKSSKIKPTPLKNGLIPVDMDVTPMDNSNTKKEGVSWTYKKFMGYAPMMAYIGKEGYMVNTELREGKRNLRKEDRNEWAEKIRSWCKNITEPREGKKVYIGTTYKDIFYTTESGEQKSITNRIVYEMIERSCDASGQYFLEPEIELNMFWTNLGESDSEIIELYHAHGGCEQFHSEIKTDMGVERLPSGKFDTNELVLELTMIAYNILRMLGQEIVRQGNAPSKRVVKRRRIRTVIQNVIHFAGQVTKHARQLILSLSRSNVWSEAYLGLTKKFSLS